MMNENGISRRNFVAGAAGIAAVAAMGAQIALADEPSAEEDAVAEGEAAAQAEKTTTIPVDESYVVNLSNGLPKWSFEVAPEPIPEDQIAETIEDDIIVVGAGMAGMCTAASAAEAGGSVTLFSASSTPISRGGSNFSAYNKVIEEYGIEKLDPVPFF